MKKENQKKSPKRLQTTLTYVATSSAAAICTTLIVIGFGPGTGPKLPPSFGR